MSRHVRLPVDLETRPEMIAFLKVLRQRGCMAEASTVFRWWLYFGARRTDKLPYENPVAARSRMWPAEPLAVALSMAAQWSDVVSTLMGAALESGILREWSEGEGESQRSGLELAGFSAVNDLSGESIQSRGGKARALAILMRDTNPVALQILRVQPDLPFPTDEPPTQAEKLGVVQLIVELVVAMGHPASAAQEQIKSARGILADALWVLRRNTEEERKLVRQWLYEHRGEAGQPTGPAWVLTHFSAYLERAKASIGNRR